MYNLKKALLCTEKMKTYFQQTALDATVEIPSEIKKGSNEHIIYIFYSCLLDYGMRSKIYHSNLINTYNNYKNIFNPKYVIINYSKNNQELLNIIKESIHHRYPNIALKKWLALSKFLYNNYPNEKLQEKILSLNTYEELYKFINNINGYGQKTGGLLVRLIYESHLCNFQDDIQNIPIDRHDIEISYLNDIINHKNLNKEEISMLSKTWIKAAKEKNISPCDIDKYLWSIGNNLCTKKKCDICPLNQNCKKTKEF